MVEVEDFDALLETAALFAKAGRPTAPGVAIVTASGGAGIMAADHAEALGLDDAAALGRRPGRCWRRRSRISARRAIPAT